MNITEDIIIHNKNCFEVFPKLEDKSINLFILDLPFGCTACKWDSVIDLEQMWKDVKRIMKPNALIVFFCTAKFGYTLIHSNPKWFKYDLIWKKSRKVGFLSANKMPLRQHENIYVFDNPVNEEYNDLELSRNKDLREYAEKVKKFIGKGLKTINKKLGHRRAEHFFYFKTSQFGLATKETYDELIEEYNIDEMEGYLEYDILKGLWEDSPPKIESTYNSQKTEGKAYKNGAIPNSDNVYGTAREKGTVTKTDRHPTSIINEIPEYEGDTILVYKNPHKTIHRTQKPVELLEWLIKTYSNEGDTVMDFTMGSGTCGIACMNQKRKFIGVEMDAEIYEAAKNRFEEHKKKSVIVI
jgi:DNA modification methylase